MKNIYRTIVFIGLSLFALASVLANSYKNPRTFQKYFYFSPRLLLLLLIIYCLVLKIKYNYRFPRLASILNNYMILPATAAISTVLTLLNYFSPPNWVYEKYGINYQPLSFIAITSFALMLIDLPRDWWRKNHRQMVFFSASLMFLIFVLIRLWPFDAFKMMVKEDHFVEWSQFSVILSASVISWLISKNVFRKNRLLGVFYFLFFMALFFIAGDEISWGQRLLDFQTPEKMNTYNLQGELTVHNLTTVTDFTWIGYMLVSIYGAFSWLLVVIIPKKLKNYAVFFTVPWYISSYFIFSLIYNSFGKPGEINIISEWAEVSELMLYLGIFFYCLFVYLRKPARA